MSRPVVLVVHPSSEVTCRFADGLRGTFKGMHVLTANSTERGLEILGRLNKDSRRLGMLLADLSSGAPVASAAKGMFPEAMLTTIGD